MPNTNSLTAMLAVAAMAILILTMPSQATEADFTNPAFAQVVGPTTVPVGHVEFCKSHSGECGPNTGAVGAIELTDARWAELVGVNNGYNSGITPVTDEDFYKIAEFWTYPDGFGDCEDIALAKRRALIADGWNPSTLLMTVVRESNGNGHAVLMVRTDRGDLVLDNKEGMIRLWSETPYQYLKRQSQANAGEWVDFTDSRLLVVAASN